MSFVDILVLTTIGGLILIVSSLLIYVVGNVVYKRCDLESRTGEEESVFLSCVTGISILAAIFILLKVFYIIGKVVVGA